MLRKMKKNIIKNSAWLMIERVYGILNGVIAGVIVVRYLGPELNGELAYINSLFAILSFMATLGLSSIITKEIIDRPQDKIKYLSSALTLQVIGTCFMGMIIISYIWFFTDYNIILVIMIWVGWLINRTQIYAQYFESKVQAKVYVSIKIISTTMSILIKLLVVHYDKGIVGIGYSYVLEALTYSILMFFLFKKDVSETTLFCFDFTLTLSMLKKGAPLLLAAVATPLFMQMDIVMLEEMTDTYNVGLYNAATKISMPLYFLMGVIVTSYYPILIKLGNKNDGSLELKIKQLIKLSYIISIVVVLPLCFFSNEIIFFLYGPDFSGAADVLRIHSFSIVFAYLAPIGSRWLLITDNLKHEFYKTLSGAIINVFLNLILINKYGITGAALSSVIAYFVSNLAYFIVTRKTRRFFWYALCLK